METSLIFSTLGKKQDVDFYSSNESDTEMKNAKDKESDVNVNDSFDSEVQNRLLEVNNNAAIADVLGVPSSSSDIVLSTPQKIGTETQDLPGLIGDISPVVLNNVMMSNRQQQENLSVSLEDLDVLIPDTRKRHCCCPG